jgi:hypothetical protein
MVGSSRSDVLDSFMAKSTHSVDFVQSVPASELKLNLLKDHRPEWVKSQIKMTEEPLTNPNKFLYHSKLYTHVYKDSFNGFKKEHGEFEEMGKMERTILGGVNFVSVNEFISNSTPPTTSSTRAMTVELYYEPFLAKGDPTTR